MKTKYWGPILLVVFIFSFTACTSPKTATETTTSETTITENTASETTEPVTTISEKAATEATTKSKIAFTSNRDGNYEVYIMNVDGSEQVRLTNNPAFDMAPSLK